MTANILFFLRSPAKNLLQTVHIMVEQEEKIPRIRITENAAPITDDILLARYNVGTARATVFPAFSKMAVFMIVIVAIRARAPNSAPVWRIAC